MKLGFFATASAAVLLAGAPAFADVQITMQDGKVSVIAKDATLRQIMAEWARVGQTKIVNVDRIPGGPMTLELKNLPEDQALEILMRPLSGYMAAPRALPAPTLSKFDRILVMPTVAAARQQATATSAPPTPVFQPPPTFQPPQAQPDDNNDDPPQAQPGQVPPTRGPVFTAFPQPQTLNPNAVTVPGNGQTFVPPPGLTMPGAAAPQQQQQPAMAPSNVPTAPVGVAVPGMVVPMPQQQPAPGQNPATVRRPGGL
jgi:hypothetical protein